MDLMYFHRPLRLLLRDWDASVQQYPDGVLDDAVRTVIQFNKMPGYVLSADQNSITPDFLDPNGFCLCSYHAAKLFVQSAPNGYSYRLRGFQERFGDLQRFLSTIEGEIHALENGDLFSGWQSYYAWLHGMTGLPLGEVLAQFNVQAPLWQATFTRDGMRVA